MRQHSERELAEMHGAALLRVLGDHAATVTEIWSRDPAIRQMICDNGMTPEEAFVSGMKYVRDFVQLKTKEFAEILHERTPQLRLVPGGRT